MVFASLLSLHDSMLRNFYRERKQRLLPAGRYLPRTLILKGHIMRLFVVALAFFALSCSNGGNYQLSTGEGGKLYRLNKSSGEVCLIEGYTITKLRQPSTTEESRQVERKLLQPNDWGSETLPTSPQITLTLKTVWRDGNLYYQLFAYPYDPVLKDARESLLASSKGFTLQLMDSTGFVLLTVLISLTDMANIVDSNGNPTEMQGKGNVPCTSDTYLGINSSSATWRL